MDHTTEYSELTTQAEKITLATFFRKTYITLAIALGVFASLEAWLLNAPFARELIGKMTEGKNWIFVLILAFAASWIADAWAKHATSKFMQCAGLAIYIVTNAIIFLPLMYFARAISPDLLIEAAVLTAALTIGLICTAIFTQTDFSFLKSIIVILSWLALGVIICAVLFDFNPGLWFSLAMIALGGASILYETSKMHKIYQRNQYIAAALSLFASIILIYYYILRALMKLRD